jgi:hypothetical protein
MFTTIEKVQDVQAQTTGVVSKYSVDSEHFERELDKIAAWRDGTTSNRYTKEDGHRMENKLDRHIEDAARRGAEE